MLKTKMFDVAVDLKITERDKLVLGIRLPNGSKEIIINETPLSKLEYIDKVYDEKLCVKNGSRVVIEEYCFIKE